MIHVWYGGTTGRVFDKCSFTPLFLLDAMNTLIAFIVDVTFERSLKKQRPVSHLRIQKTLQRAF